MHVLKLAAKPDDVDTFIQPRYARDDRNHLVEDALGLISRARN
jgi:hypothetical protein